MCSCVYVCGFCNVFVCVCGGGVCNVGVCVHVGFVVCGCVYMWIL